MTTFPQLVLQFKLLNLLAELWAFLHFFFLPIIAHPAFFTV